MTEGQYQTKLIKKLKDLFPGCIVLRNDSAWIQGIPDLLILYNMRWAALEIKLDESARLRPNQLYYVDKMEEMSFAAVIYPENEDRVLNDLQFSFGAPWGSRVS